MLIVSQCTGEHINYSRKRIPCSSRNMIYGETVAWFYQTAPKSSDRPNTKSKQHLFLFVKCVGKISFGHKSFSFCALRKSCVIWRVLQVPPRPLYLMLHIQLICSLLHWGESYCFKRIISSKIFSRVITVTHNKDDWCLSLFWRRSFPFALNTSIQLHLPTHRLQNGNFYFIFSILLNADDKINDTQ